MDLAEHRYIARRAAIKFLLKELISSEEVFNRFFTEARAASLIEHPGIIEVQDCGVHTDGRAYMIMEFLNGESVRGYLERTGKMDKDREGALAISRQVAAALGAAHEQGIVHRDLKPDNIFLHIPSARPATDPVVKVLDFGIAKLIGGSAAGTKTRTGNLLGTPLYMSPEQCRGSGSIDNRSDIYSLGCIMYELFCGTPPFVAEGLGDLIVAHVAQPPPDPPGVTPAIRSALLACLTKDPNKRPQSMAELGRMLTEAGAGEIVRLKKAVSFSAAAAQGPNSGINSPVGIRSPAALAATTPPPAGIPAFSPPTPGAGGTIKAQPTPVTAPGQPREATKTYGSATAPSETTLGRTAGEVVDLEGIPAGAAVSLDGRPAVLPLQLPRGADKHRITVTAAGFEPFELSVDGSKDQSVSVTLKKTLASAEKPAEKPADKPSGKSHHKSDKSERKHGGFSGFSDL